MIHCIAAEPEVHPQIKMAEVSVNTRAHCKLLLHAAKYPHRAVNGLLLAEDSKSKESHKVKILDCIPLFHITLGLAPILEVALTQVSLTTTTACATCKIYLSFLFIVKGRFFCQNSDVKLHKCSTLTKI